MKARSNALKLLMNSAYGLFGSPRGYNCPEAAARVTAIGRAILHSMIDKLTELGATIIECDTDGIYYSSENEVHDKVQAVLPTGIRIEPENKWTWGVFYKSKNYFIMKKDGMWDCKGVFRKRDTPKFKIEFMQQYADLYRGDPAAAEAYYQSLLHQILSGEYPVDNLSVKKKIGKAEKARLKFGKPGESKTTYQGYGEPMKRGGFKKTCVMEGPYNKEFYSKMLTEFYTELKGIFGGSHESS
jgi:DNA polymerase elongation subunit (family B)